MCSSDLESNLYIDEYTSLSDILTLNSYWTETSSILEDHLYKIVNKDNDLFNIGYVPCGDYCDYYAIDSGLDCYIKLHVKYDN